MAAAILEMRRLLREADYGAAEARARALLGARESLDPASLDAGRVLDVLVQALVEGGRAADPDALAAANRAVRLKETLLGPEDPELAASLANLGLVLRRLGRIDEAEQHYERALRIRERALGAGHAEVARTLAALAALANNRGDFARGRQLGERAVAIAERAQPGDPVAVAVSANNLAIALYELNDYAGSQSRLEQALHAYETALGPDHPEVAKALSNLANLVGESGNLLAARDMYERALAIQQRRQGADHPDVALGLNNLAEIHFLLGDYSEARALFARALAILERALGARHTRVAMALGNLAQVLVALGEYAAAEPLYARALRIREGVGPSDHPSLVYTLTGLGDLRRRLGKRASARASYERALAIAERAFGSTHPMVAVALQGLAELLLADGDLAGAEERVRRALEIRRRLLGDDHPLVAESLAALALILARGGRATHAVDAALEAERVSREHLQVTAQALSERQATLYAGRRVSGEDVALSVLETGAVRDSDVVRRTWDAVVRSRAAILEEVASRQRLVAAVSEPELARLAGDLVAARERLAGLLARSASDPAARARVEQAARERDERERALAERSVAFRTEQRRGRAGLADALARLPAGGALVAFVRFRRQALRAGGRPAEAYMAFVARSDGSPVAAIPLGGAGRLESAVDSWRRGIESEIEAGRATARAERLQRRAGLALRRLVWDPLRQALKGATQAFVVPDGALHLVNLAALPGEGGGFLLEQPMLLHSLSAERDLCRPATQPGRGLLIVDDPAYDGDVSTSDRRTAARVARAAVRNRGVAASSPCRDLKTLRFDPLPETRREADAIAALWRSSAPPRPDAGGDTAARIVRLDGARATEAAVRRSVRGVRVLHLATHGFFAGAWCDLSQPASPRPPLLLAGLALAGANRRQGATAEEDGVLMAEEVASLDLRGVEWTVLSACDTGRGIARNGEGLFGLRRMFEIAGARTVLVTLWPVEDAATREWMAAAYRHRFVDGQPTAESVRMATLELLRRRRGRGQSTHPAYWAPFLAVGR